MTTVESSNQQELVEAARTPLASAPRESRSGAPAAKEEANAATDVERRYKILRIVDDAESAALLREELERRGFAVFAANDALQELSLLLKWQPDLALSDVSMLGMSGLDILRRRNQVAPNCARIPFI